MASTSVSASAAAAGDAQQRPAADPGAFASMATAMQQHRYHPYHPFPHGVVGAAPIPMSSAYASSYASLASVPQQQQQQQQQQVVMTMAPAMAATTNTDAAAATGALQCHPSFPGGGIGGVSVASKFPLPLSLAPFSAQLAQQQQQQAAISAAAAANPMAPVGGSSIGAAAGPQSSSNANPYYPNSLAMTLTSAVASALAPAYPVNLALASEYQQQMRAVAMQHFHHQHAAMQQQQQHWQDLTLHQRQMTMLAQQHMVLEKQQVVLAQSEVVMGRAPNAVQTTSAAGAQMTTSSDLNDLKLYYAKAKDSGLDMLVPNHDGVHSNRYLKESLAFRLVVLAVSYESVESRKGMGYHELLELRPPGAPCLRAMIEKDMLAAYPDCMKKRNPFSMNWTNYKSKSGDVLRKMAMKADHEAEMDARKKGLPRPLLLSDLPNSSGGSSTVVNEENAGRTVPIAADNSTNASAPNRTGAMPSAGGSFLPNHEGMVPGSSSHGTSLPVSVAMRTTGGSPFGSSSVAMQNMPQSVHLRPKIAMQPQAQNVPTEASKPSGIDEGSNQSAPLTKPSSFYANDNCGANAIGGRNQSGVSGSCSDQITKRFASRPPPIEFDILYEEMIKTAQNNLTSLMKTEGQRSTRVIDCHGRKVPKWLRGRYPAAGGEVDLDDVTAVTEKILGKGVYGTVMLCRSKKATETFAGEQALALKIQAPTGSLAHEYHILRLLEERLGEHDVDLSGLSEVGARKRKRPSGSPSDEVDLDRRTFPPTTFPKAFSYVQFDDGALLGMSSASSSGVNLVDLVNAYLLKKEPIPELISIYYASRMLLHLEKLHCVGKILHNDVKPDNWVVSGENGADITLVDFGRSADLVEAGDGDHLSVSFTGNEAAQGMACPPMRKNKSWCFETDAYGLVASSFLLLDSSHLDIVETADGTWTPCKKLKRYWWQNGWSRVFQNLLNARSGDVPALMCAIRREFDQYLDEGNRRSNVQSLLAHQKTLLPQTKSND